MQQNVSKTHLRKQLRKQRRELSTEVRMQAGRDALHTVRKQRLIAAGRRIAIYWPFDGELDTTDLIAHAWSVQAQVFLPLVSALDRRRLGFAAFDPDTHLTLDRYGIVAPQPGHMGVFSAQKLDLIFLPLVGFDRSGSRLGMGAGHYDATVSSFSGRRTWHRPRLIGLGYSFQEVEVLPRDPWDLTLHGVVTEKEFIQTKFQ